MRTPLSIDHPDRSRNHSCQSDSRYQDPHVDDLKEAAILCCLVVFSDLSLERTGTQRLSVRRSTADDRQFQYCLIEIDLQLRSRLRPQGEVSIAGEDHQSETLAGGNDLIVWL